MLVQDIYARVDSSNPCDFTVSGSYLFFSAEEGTYGRELWVLPLGEVSLDKSALVFNSTFDQNVPSSQVSTGSHTVRVGTRGPGPVDWSVSSDRSWLIVSSTSGTGNGSFTVAIDPTKVPHTSWNGTLTLTSAEAFNSPQKVNVSGTFYGKQVTRPPYGYFDTPADGATGISGNISVSGWALDDIEVTGVEIWRDPVGAETGSVYFIGDAVFVAGARPDVEVLNSGMPFDYRAGWGYMMLTNFLPNQGSGTYVIHAIAHDKEGRSKLLGSKTITVNNAAAVKPFGTIDTPAPAGVASGSAYRNWGWALTPQPKTIPLDGSTLDVFLDGVPIGKVTYGFLRPDIQLLFPGFQNTDSAVGYFDLDTTAYENGPHNIAWRVEDEAGSGDGIGSRYFMIEN